MNSVIILFRQGKVCFGAIKLFKRGIFLSNSKSKKKTEQRIEGAKKRMTAAEKQAARDAADKAAFMEKLNASRRALEGLPGTDSAPIPLKKRDGRVVELPFNPARKRREKKPEPLKAETKPEAQAAQPSQEPKSAKKSGRRKKAQPAREAAPSAPVVHIKPERPHRAEKSASPLKVMALGGLHEIGKNLYVFEYENDMIVVDVGLEFPDQDMLGIDVVIPDFTYLLNNRDKVRGIVVTHGHEDHIGGLPYLMKELDTTIYSTRMTQGLIEAKFVEHGLKGKVNMNTVRAGDRIKLGCFEVEFITVNHSIPDAVALAIKTPVGTLVHTGDFKIDTTPTQGGMIDLARFAELGNEGVLALLMDSTNAERPGYTMSERRVSQSLEGIFKNAEGKRIIIATFSSNVYRVQQIIDIAAALGRKVALSGRSMVNVTAIAEQLGYIKLPAGVLLDINALDKYPKDQTVIITTGSQGETMSALYRMAYSDHRKVVVSEDDLIVLSSNPIPGNEKFVTNIVNELMKLGCSVVYESLAEVHTSGHACQEELKLMLGLVKPKFYIPVHGEFKHLKKAQMLGESMGIPTENILISDNGKVIELTPDSAAFKGEVPTGSVFVDGTSVGDVGAIVMRERRQLASDGLIVVAVSVDRQTGSLMGEPEIISRGFVYMRESEELLGQLKEMVTDCVERNATIGVHDYNALKTVLRDDLSKAIFKQSKRTPMVIPVIARV